MARLKKIIIRFEFRTTADKTNNRPVQYMVRYEAANGRILAAARGLNNRRNCKINIRALLGKDLTGWKLIDETYKNH